MNPELYEQCETCKGKTHFLCEVCICPPTETCVNCSGSGQVLCSNCDGTGKKRTFWGSSQCAYCHGSGGNRCLHCSGNGVRECHKCHGTGRNPSCSKCGGRLVLRCPLCNGEGRTFSSELRALARGSNDSWEIAHALADAHDRRCLPLLERFLFENVHFSRRRIEVAERLGRLGVFREETVRFLIKLIDEQVYYNFLERVPTEGAMYLFELRRTAVEALGHLGAAEGLESLMKLLPRSKDISESALDYSFCETTIAALLETIDRSGNSLKSSDLRALAEIRDCEFSGWKLPPGGHYNARGRISIRLDYSQLREVAKRALGRSTN